MKSFSQRKGLKPTLLTIQTESMSDDLRNSLWNVIDQGDFGSLLRANEFSRILWDGFFKRPIDTRPIHTNAMGHFIPGYIVAEIREFFFSADWNEVYDFLEFTLSHCGAAARQLEKILNNALARELAGYRFVDGIVVDITDEQEIELLDTALQDTQFISVATHLEAALRLLANRDNPDYRNSVKESISAVEAMAKIVVGGNSAKSLGQALTVLEKQGRLHPSLKKGFSNLYGYTSDGDGIRHSLMDGDSTLTQSDAKYFLLSCTSFINYLKSKI